MKRIGILGGMGPESTAAFYSAVIRQCQKQYGARKDEDYPEIFIYSLPIADIVSDSRTQKVKKQLTLGIRKLEEAGADLIAIPCNTVFSVCPEIEKAGKVMVLNIIVEALKAAKATGYGTLGLLATANTIKSGIYQSIAVRMGLTIKVPDNQDEINQIILNILAGSKNSADRARLIKTCDALRQQGADAIILGCTDIQLLLRHQDTDAKLLDTLMILAAATVAAASPKPARKA